MKVQRWDQILSLNNNDNECLSLFRRYRGFNISDYLEIKIKMITDFFKQSCRNSVILGMSGGIDSALSYYLLKEVSKNIDLKIHLINIPIDSGTTDQKEGSILSRLVCDSVSVIDLTDIQILLADKVSTIFKQERTAWSDGQLASCLRSPVYYYIASLLTDRGERPVVCGTINRSEGAYLGYWGKTSDASVDIQILSDLYKSEIYKLAHYFNIPDVIIKNPPKGDVYDKSSDIELFGVTYDALELFIENKCFPSFLLSHNKSLSTHFVDIEKRIEQMHSYNSHKYYSPACGIWGKHLNVLESGCPGGWPMTKVKDTYPTMIHGEFT